MVSSEGRPENDAHWEQLKGEEVLGEWSQLGILGYFFISEFIRDNDCSLGLA